MTSKLCGPAVDSQVHWASAIAVETGPDIPNANTLILDQAEILSLSQMHHLRGRVGRGRERDYA